MIVWLALLKTKYTVKPTMQFKKDYKLAIKHGLKNKLLEDIIAALMQSSPSVVSCLTSETGSWQAEKEKSRNIPCSVQHFLIKYFYGVLP